MTQHGFAAIAAACIKITHAWFLFAIAVDCYPVKLCHGEL